MLEDAPQDKHGDDPKNSKAGKVLLTTSHNIRNCNVVVGSFPLTVTVYSRGHIEAYTYIYICIFSHS